MKIRFLTEAHRKNYEAAMKKIEEWNKRPVDIQKLAKMQDESLKQIMAEEARNSLNKQK